MNLRLFLLIVAGALFGLSFGLPSFGETPSSMMSGFMCCFQCAYFLARLNFGSGANILTQLYYSGFAAANALFVVLFAAAICSTSNARSNRWIWGILSLQFIGWIIFQFRAGGTMPADVLIAVLCFFAIYSASHVKARRWVSAAILVQVLSWPIVNWASIPPFSHGIIGIGYFLWLAAFILLFGISFMSFRMPNQSPDPMPAPGMPPAGQE